MTETRNTGDKTITVAPKKKLSLKRGNIERDTVRQSFSHGRTNTVQVERKKRRIVMPGEVKPEAVQARQAPEPVAAIQPEPVLEEAHAAAPRGGLVLRQLSDDEMTPAPKRLPRQGCARRKSGRPPRSRPPAAPPRRPGSPRSARTPSAARPRKRSAARPRKPPAPAPKTRRADGSAKKRRRRRRASWLAAFGRRRRRTAEDEERAGALRGRVKTKTPAEPKPVKRGEERRRGKLTLVNALDDTERERSLASIRRRRERERARAHETGPREKIMREVVIPETITIQELPTAWPSGPSR